MMRKRDIIMTLKTKDIVFDIDGTLANLNHRLHYMKDRPKNWKGFHKGVREDGVYDDVVWLLKMFQANGCRIVIATGRSDRQKDDTIWWLENVAKISFDAIYMREKDDYRDDGIVKKEMLDQMRLDGYEPYMVFDDRNRVVDMWRENGVRCMQVAPGDF
jgi:hydroxymethylpyrimidine pyrophosphatase-like HAD family hydrolase